MIPMADPDRRLDQMVEKLRDRGYRLTPQRLAVLKILAISHGHPSVERIHEQVKIDFPTTSLATVYKTVSLARELGEVLELGFSDDRNRYDGNKPYPHPHLICTQCRNIIDPDLSNLQHMTEELEKETGFRIVNHRMDFFGICPDCRG